MRVFVLVCLSLLCVCPLTPAQPYDCENYFIAVDPTQTVTTLFWTDVAGLSARWYQNFQPAGLFVDLTRNSPTQGETDPWINLCSVRDLDPLEYFFVYHDGCLVTTNRSNSSGWLAVGEDWTSIGRHWGRIKYYGTYPNAPQPRPAIRETTQQDLPVGNLIGNYEWPHHIIATNAASSLYETLPVSMDIASYIDSSQFLCSELIVAEVPRAASTLTDNYLGVYTLIFNQVPSLVASLQIPIATTLFNAPITHIGVEKTDLYTNQPYQSSWVLMIDANLYAHCVSYTPASGGGTFGTVDVVGNPWSCPFNLRNLFNPPLSANTTVLNIAATRSSVGASRQDFAVSLYDSTNPLTRGNLAILKTSLPHLTNTLYGGGPVARVPSAYGAGAIFSGQNNTEGWYVTTHQNGTFQINAINPANWVSGWTYAHPVNGDFVGSALKPHHALGLWQQGPYSMLWFVVFSNTFGGQWAFELSSATSSTTIFHARPYANSPYGIETNFNPPGNHETPGTLFSNTPMLYKDKGNVVGQRYGWNY
jgi:hypothetical protein